MTRPPLIARFPQKRGKIYVICGGMFAGKTEELIRIQTRAEYANLRVRCYKPTIDNRYSDKHIISHKGSQIPTKPIDTPQQILQDYEKEHIDIIIIDEGQFMDNSIINISQELADKGCDVIIAGLDMDFKRNPFGPMPQLMAIADEIIKLKAICQKCGAEALYSHRLINQEDKILLGGKNTYIALCRTCYLNAK